MQISKIPHGFINPLELEVKLETKTENYWIRRGELRALELFKLMSQRVPAYKDFLKRNKIKPDLIKKISDFKKIPSIDKNNYLRAYPLESLCWDGKLKDNRWTISTNSGSTGDPFYFPREIQQDFQYAAVAELYLRNNFNIHKKSTLYLDCFAMGAWIGGLFTYETIRLVAERGKYPLTIFTPGIFKEEILKAVRILGPKFDQVIIGGYPPFIKDIIDEGVKEGIDWQKYNLGFVFSAEGFTEEFRDYVYRVSGVRDYFRGSLNHYGTADMGTMAHETPLTILIRKVVNNNPKFTSLLFPEEKRLPTLVQYFPDLFYFEQENDVLYCSAYSGLPFIRYDLKDYGGILKFGEVFEKLAYGGLNLNEEIQRVKINVWRLPFVYLYERKDFVVKLYGANIFPETVRHALQQKKFENYLTSKFTLMIKFDENNDQYLEINVELRRNVRRSVELVRKIQNESVKYLLRENSEYYSNYKTLRDRQIPKVILWPYECQHLFKPGIKQKWVINKSQI